MAKKDSDRQAGDNFVHLHNHSSFSLLDGLAKPINMAARAKELGQTHMALTDHGVLYGSIDFIKAMRAEDIVPILGIEAYLVTDLEDGASQRFHQTLLAMNPDGWESIKNLSTESYLRGLHGKPRIDLDMMKRHSNGVLCLSGCIAGILCQTIIHGGDADEVVELYIKIYGRKNFVIELMYHGSALNPATDEVEDIVVDFQDDRLFTNSQLNQELWLLAQRHKLKCVATNDCHYVWPDDSIAHDMLFGISVGVGVNDAHRTIRFAGSDFGCYPFYIKSGPEMKDLPFESIDTFGGGYERMDPKIKPEEWYDVWSDICDYSQVLADRCSNGYKGIEFDRPPIIPAYEIPKSKEFRKWQRKKQLAESIRCSCASSARGRKRSASMVR